MTKGPPVDSGGRLVINLPGPPPIGIKLQAHLCCTWYPWQLSHTRPPWSPRLGLPEMIVQFNFLFKWGMSFWSKRVPEPEESPLLGVFDELQVGYISSFPHNSLTHKGYGQNSHPHYVSRQRIGFPLSIWLWASTKGRFGVFSQRLPSKRRPGKYFKI